MSNGRGDKFRKISTIVRRSPTFSSYALAASQSAALL
jgi:hypothetical protein